MSEHYATAHRYCDRCGTSCYPNWSLVEIFPDRRTYEVLCRRCRQRRDAEFTPERAISDAELIVWITVGRLNAIGGVR